MRYYYDTEFIEDGRTIELVSIGIVAEDGREYYAVNGDVHWERLGKPQFAWIRENVWRHLPTTGPGQLSLTRYNSDVKPRIMIAEDVKQFLLYGYAYPTPEYREPVGKPELWADYPAYDHVALCQLWGRMMDLPDGIPMRTNDIVQLAESLGISEHQFPQQDEKTKHHALHDARHNKLVWNSIHPEGFHQQHRRNQVAIGQRRGVEGGEPAISLMTRGRTFNGQPVTDLPL